MSMNDSAVAMHEFYSSLRRGGFGRWEALWLTGCMVKGVPLPDWLADKLRNTEDE